MRETMSNLIIALSIGVCIALAGCESDSSSSSDTSDTESAGTGNTPNDQSNASIVGTWSGPFSIGPYNPQTTHGTIVFHANGTLTMSPTDGGDGGGTYTVSGTTVSGIGRVSESPIHFTGTLSGDTIEGTWYDANDDNNHFRITRQS